MIDQKIRRFLNAQPSDKLIQGFLHQGPEYAVEMIGAEMGHSCKLIQPQGTVEVLFDIIDHPVNPGHILLTELSMHGISHIKSITN